MVFGGGVGRLFGEVGEDRSVSGYVSYCCDHRLELVDMR